MDNISQQLDEIEVLKSIFGDEWEVNTETELYSIQVEKDVKLFITLNPGYPANSPPSYDLLAPNLSSQQKDLIKDEFQKIYNEERGNPIIFQWIEKLKEIVGSYKIAPPVEICIPTDTVEKDNKQPEDILNLMNIVHGQTIIDRKSVFQGHACTVTKEKDVKKFMNYLLQNKKIAQAAHNILAYRILLPNSMIIQDCDDDGEAHASGRILHLLQILKLTNVMVVVTRWYGGVHLGPDRFKHINNAARQVLVEGGFIKAGS